jgi:DNA-binding CsgD family transcriptional regulator
MHQNKRFLYGCFWVIALHCAVFLGAQAINLGIPPIHNFSKKTYHGGTQNWDAAQAPNGVLFFANNEGLLQFDGGKWACYPMPNKTVVRSVAIDPNGRIFVGAQNELGYFFPQKNGQLVFHSLVGNLPPNKRNFEDVWEIVPIGGAVFFRTNRVVFRYDGRNLEVHEPGGDLMALFKAKEGLVLQRNFSEFLVFGNSGFTPAFTCPAIKSAITGAMQGLGDTMLLATLKNGLFSLVGQQVAAWATPHDPKWQSDRIYSATRLPNGHFALGSSLGGLYVLDGQKRIYHHLTRREGLQHNNVLHVFADRDGNAWLGLDSGIDCVALPAPITAIVPDGELKGTGYAASVFGQHLYLGVSNGVYRTPWKDYYNPENKPFFEKINTTEGQVWSLAPFSGELMVGHHEGSFGISGQGTTKISDVAGAWTFVQMTERYMIGGNYGGLVLYQKTGDKWVLDHVLKGLSESCRFMVKEDDGTLWVSHPYRGVFRILWSEANKSKIEVAFFDAQHGLPSNLNNFVFSVAGKAVFATEKGVFRFDKAHNSFVPDDDFGRVLGMGTPLKYLREDAKGNIWYVGEQEVGCLMVNDWGLKKSIQKRVFPELSDKLVNGFEFINPIGPYNVLFGAEHGFFLYNAPENTAQDSTIHLFINKVSAHVGGVDSVLFGGWWLDRGQLVPQQPEEDRPVLPHGVNSVVFSFAATVFGDPSQVQYRYRLVGTTDEWSDWTEEHLFTFPNLEPGNYRFEVQARIKHGPESAVLAFGFRIRPPWYASAWAITLYTIVFLGLFVGFWIRQRLKFESEKEDLTMQHQQIAAEQQREVEESRAALSDVMREKLEADIQYKNKELAIATLHLVQKGELLQTVQKNLDQILDKSTNPTIKKDIQQLLNLLNFDTTLNDDWEQFAYHFDQVHVDFLKRLREKHPQLTTIDHKLCAYLKMNLSTKEMAPLMNISVRGIEANRYRLRKKLGLPNEANLTEFIADV